MKRMLTEYRVGPRSSVPPCESFPVPTIAGRAGRDSEAAERDLSVGGGPRRAPAACAAAVGGDPWGRRRQSSTAAIIELPKLRLEPGMRVKVLQGPLHDQIGLLAALRPHERVLVLLQLLGGQQRVELAQSSIEVMNP